ncbi:MAG TPA: GyrI-like domain-containing protein [Mucilaginibacter sp.]|nr:GyrI-like domain-containing protein [Mucilaginibacter sp.]
MEIKVFNSELKLNIFGLSGIAVNKNYAGTAFALMDKAWLVIRSKELKNKGLNIWVYEPGEKVFAGVELEDHSAVNTGLEQKIISLSKYAYYKHTGPYSQLGQAGDNMQNELRRKGLHPRLPFIEIYGHWTPDETALETELLMAFE